MLSAERQRRKEAARARVAAALEDIQRAQALLDRAAQNLSPICYGAAGYKAAGRTRERVRDLWYRVRRLGDSPRIYLDHDPAQAGEEMRPC